MKLISIFFACFLFLTGCSPQQNELVLSDVSLVDISEHINGEDYFYPQILGLGNEAVQNRANEILKQEFLVTNESESDVIFGFCVYVEPTLIQSELVFLSQDFITVGFHNVYYGVNRFYVDKVHCTIDLKTGEQVLLDDLIKDFTEFAAYLGDGNYIYPNYQVKNIDDILVQANLSYREFYLNNPTAITYKNTFYLEDELLCIQHAAPNSSTEMCIPIEDIYTYLINPDLDYTNFIGPRSGRDW